MANILVERNMYPSADSRINQWFTDLADFLVRSNERTYASDAPGDPSFIANDKPHSWADGDWQIKDIYAASLSAPGVTFVVFNGKLCWYDAYFDEGMVPQFYPIATKVFDFLKLALLAANLRYPVRGKPGFEDKNFQYDFYYLESTYQPLRGCDWEETVRIRGDHNPIVFRQRGHCQIYVYKDKNGNPIYPWDF